jgi:hypothetical protein
MMKIEPAKGLEGQLIYTGAGHYVFRVYDENYDFTDYAMCHADLSITITDNDAALYRDDNGDRLDHSPATLGIKDEAE